MNITKRKNKDNRKRQLWRRGYVIFLLIAVCCLLGGILARYVHQTQTGTGQITAENFYFTADLLGDTKMLPVEGTSQQQYSFGEKSTEGTWNLYGSSEHQIQIQVQNYYDTLRVTEKDIHFTGEVSVEKADGTKVEKGSASIFPALKKESQDFTEGTISSEGGSNGVADTIVVDIPSCSKWAYEDETVVTVKISSTVPYKKTLTLKFVLYTTDTTLRYKIVDSVGSPYAELILMTDADNAVQPYLIWSEKLSIDNTNPLTFTYDSSTNIFTQQAGMEERNMQISQKLQTGRSESIYFFKADTSENYASGETIVQPSDDRYIVKVGKQAE